MSHHRLEVDTRGEGSLPSSRQLTKLVETAFASAARTGSLARGGEMIRRSIVHRSSIAGLSDSESPANVQHRLGGRYQPSFGVGPHAYTLYDTYLVEQWNGFEAKSSTRYFFEWTDHQTVTAIRSLNRHRRSNTHRFGLPIDNYTVPDFTVPSYVDEVPDMWRLEADYQQITPEDCKKLIEEVAEHFDTIDQLVRR